MPNWSSGHERSLMENGAFIICICVIRVHHHCGSFYRSLQHILYGTSPVTNELWDSWRSGGGWQWWVRNNTVQGQCPRRFVGISSHDPSVPKSNWLLHVVIFRVFTINLRYVPWINSSKTISYFPEFLHFNRLIHKLNPFIRNYHFCRVKVTPGSWSSSPLSL
jgi:hypothetical protein